MRRATLIVLALVTVLASSAPVLAQKTEGGLAEDFGVALGLFGLIVLGILVFIFLSPFFRSGESEKTRNGKKLVYDYSDGSGSATWYYWYFDDHSGYRDYNYYMSGEVYKTTRRHFTWNELGEPVNWQGEAETISSKYPHAV